MIVQSTSALLFANAVARMPSSRQSLAALPTNTADSVHISQAAREALAASSFSNAASNDTSVEARLAVIKAKDCMSRSQEDWDYLFANDQKLAEITAKQNQNPSRATADEVDYAQKARGLVNTMANLSPAEKSLYDKAVASGNPEVAAAIGKVGFIRTMGHTAGDANGAAYDPLNTKMTAVSIEKFFSHSIVDPTGKAQSQFQALIQFLKTNPVS